MANVDYFTSSGMFPINDMIAHRVLTTLLNVAKSTISVENKLTRSTRRRHVQAKTNYRLNIMKNNLDLWSGNKHSSCERQNW